MKSCKFSLYCLLIESYFNYSVTSQSANDGKWHHICQSWENKGGSWKLYKDGVVVAKGTGLKTGQVLKKGGSIMLGLSLIHI